MVDGDRGQTAGRSFRWSIYEDQLQLCSAIDSEVETFKGRYTDRVFFDHEIRMVYDGKSTATAMAAGFVGVGVTRWGGLIEPDKVLLALSCFSQAYKVQFFL